MTEPTNTEKSLAINGGPKAKTAASEPYHKVHVEELLELMTLWGLKEETLARVEELIRDEVTGPHLFRYYGSRPSKVRQFEEAFAEALRAKYVLAVNSGTSALVAAAVAAGIGPGDEVIVPAYTFFASVAIVVVAKAIPVIAEVDASLNLDPNDVANKITDQTRAIIPVHMQGVPARMHEIMEIARDRNLVVIEDCCQADGGSYRGRRLGTIGTLGCFSLDFYKMITSGEGGAVATDDEFLYTRAQSWHDTAACWRPDRYARERRAGELFCGEDYRMSELQGAVALVQVRKMDDVLRRYRAAYDSVLSQVKMRPGLALRDNPDPEGHCAYNMTFILPSADIVRKFIPALKAEGVPAGGLYDKQIRDWHVYSNWEHILERKTVTKEGCPFTCPYYKGELPEYSPDMCPRTLDYLTRCVGVRISPTMTEEECTQVAHGINKVAAAYLTPGLRG